MRQRVLPTSPTPEATRELNPYDWLDNRCSSSPEQENDYEFRLGVLPLLEAKPGKSDELAAFLQEGRELALAEQGTVTWYAFKINDSKYGMSGTPRPTIR
ncbi:hypothetical protein ACFYYH_13295 [Streptomyces sp. NPDC002018]|uniref:hypothetical protein n=1 Tax=Streptomyces sp. NPDC002018 TaxID=3364629 RepID=UPI003678C7FC